MFFEYRKHLSSNASKRSAEFLLRNVVHRQVVHVGLDELQGFFLDHSLSMRIHHLLEFHDLLSGNAFALFGHLKGFLQNSLDVSHALSSLSHAEAEVAEPLVIKCNSPVFTEELNCVWNDTLFVSVGQLIEIVFMQTNEAPETLEDDFLATHVCNRVNQPNSIESKLDEMSFLGLDVKVVASEASLRLLVLLRLTGVEEQRIGCLDVVVDNITWEHTSLTLWKVETWQFFFHAIILGL